MTDQDKIEKVKEDLKLRDERDSKIDVANRHKIEASGLTVQKPGKTISIDTGVVVGVENVVDQIMQELKKNGDFRVLTICGLSGTGKSKTAEQLTERLEALTFSMGVLFRYVSLRNLQHGEDDFPALFARLSYHVASGVIYLFDEKKNVAKEYAIDLRQTVVEDNVPKTSAQTQELAIALVAGQMKSLKEETVHPILLEGRAFTLDFIPSDVRVELTASDDVRAERRWKDLEKLSK